MGDVKLQVELAPNAGPYVSLLGRTERTKVLFTELKFPRGKIHDRSALLLHPHFAVVSPNLGLEKTLKIAQSYRLDYRGGLHLQRWEGILSVLLEKMTILQKGNEGKDTCKKGNVGLALITLYKSLGHLILTQKL